MTRRPAGAGTVETTTTGRYRVRVTHSDGSRPTIGIYETEAEAREVLDAYLIQAANAGAAATGGVTLRTFGPKFLQARELAGSRGIDDERDRWNAHIETAFFIDWPIRDIQARDVRAWRDEVAAKRATVPAKGGGRKPSRRRLSHSSVKNALGLLKQAMKAAFEEGLIDASPAVEVTLKKRVVVDEPWTYLLDEEQRALIECPALPLAERLMMQFAIGTGLRKGEQWSLKLIDLHVDDAEPYVWVRYGKPGKPTKSGKARRVPLFGLGLDAAQRWLALLPKWATSNPKRLVFPTRFGHCRYGRKMRIQIVEDGKRRTIFWPEALTLAGIDRPVRWHDLRHTCASSLAAGWWGRRWTLHEIKEMLGHTSIRVTERYAHLAPSALTEAARATPLRSPHQAHHVNPNGEG